MTQIQKTKIVICGGHLSPALALIESINKDKKFDIYYFGRKTALEGNNVESLEYISIKKIGIPFYPIYGGRLQRWFTLYTLWSLFKIPVSFFQSFYYLLTIRPNLVISFGSYVALPIGVAAGILHIPLILHEQTHILGLTNRILCIFAKILCLSFAQTKKVFQRCPIEVTGILIRPDLLSLKRKDITDFGNKKLPLIYITGGSSGSRSINKIVSQSLADLSSKYRLIHQTGTEDDCADYINLTKLKKKLPLPIRSNIKIVKQIDYEEIGSVLRETGLIIGRSGANTVAEVAYLGIPAIFIPLPWSADNEQEINAGYLVRYGGAIILKQNQLTKNLLADTVDNVMGNLEKFRRKAQLARNSENFDTSGKLLKIIYSFINID